MTVRTADPGKPAGPPNPAPNPAPGPRRAADDPLLSADLAEAEQSPVLSNLGRILAGNDFAWSLELVGEDQAGKLATLNGDLRRHAAPAGAGKRIASGISYLAAESAIAWVKACQDPYYPVMRRSIESFEGRWSSIRSQLAPQPYHYVSLGPGDGEKDAVILRDLRRDNSRLCYVPVDSSDEMLRRATNSLTGQLKLSRSRALPIRLDFSTVENLTELRSRLDQLFGSEPVLFSLIGNTVANFENDVDLLARIASTLLRAPDRMVVEVATTPQLNQALAAEASAEYANSRTFREFVTSSLAHYTNLRIDMDSVLFEGTVEGDRALLIKIIYENRTGQELRITLPDRTDVPFPPGDTIRLYTTRKYSAGGVASLLADSGVDKLYGTHRDFTRSDGGTPFGMELAVVAARAGDPAPDRTVAADVWSR